MVVALACVWFLALPAAVGAAKLVDPAAELRNLAIGRERANAWATPALVAGVARADLAYNAQRAAVTRADPERAPDPNVCTTVVACFIDPRLADPGAHGIVARPVLFTARSGATLSGTVWAARHGAIRRRGVVIVNGSILGSEQIYWYAAQALALDGYEALTFDVQGEGMSDQFGQAPDQLEGAFAGTPPLNLRAPRGFGASGIGATACRSTTAARMRWTSSCLRLRTRTCPRPAGPLAPATSQSRAGEWRPG